MRTLTRKKIGVVLAILAPVVFVALAVGGVKLITVSSKHFEETGATSSSARLHWPLIIPSVIFVAGVALIVFPRRERAA